MSFEFHSYGLNIGITELKEKGEFETVHCFNIHYRVNVLEYWEQLNYLRESRLQYSELKDLNCTFRGIGWIIEADHIRILFNTEDEAICFIYDMDKLSDNHIDFIRDDSNKIDIRKISDICSLKIKEIFKIIGKSKYRKDNVVYAMRDNKYMYIFTSITSMQAHYNERIKENNERRIENW